MMKAARWQDYSVLATGDGYKFERWKEVYLLRPDPQVIWKASFNFDKDNRVFAKYIRSTTGGGNWEIRKPLPSEWVVRYGDLSFKVKPMGFKHTGLFPEQAVNWDFLRNLIKNAGRQINVLNLFAYTGGATIACAKQGAKVCHVDSAKAMVERAGENAKLSGVESDKIRYIVDDCRKFVEREIRRGKSYDGIIMDPPSFGRGANNEVWKLETELFSLVELCSQVLSANPLFFLINSYTTGLQAQVMKNILEILIKKKHGGTVDAYEVGIETEEEGIILPCGNSGIWTNID